MYSCLLHAPYWGPSPGMCPEWELNQGPFGSQAGAQSTEPHQPGLLRLILSKELQLAKPFLHARHCLGTAPSSAHKAPAE